jgi:hypothetical protein
MSLFSRCLKFGGRRTGKKRESALALGQSEVPAASRAPSRELKELEVPDRCTTQGSRPESESAVATTERGERTRIADRDERIQRSQVHWSQVSEAAMDRDKEGAAEIENKEVFKSLQQHPTWGGFFITFGYDLVWESSGGLEVGEKFAEGGQAELFHAHITWANPKYNEEDLEDGTEWVIKVFKKGTLLRHLQSQWPEGYLQWWAKDLERSKLGIPPGKRHTCSVMYGTLLEDGRFGFLMTKEDEDLQSVIDRNMKTNIGKSHGPFEKESEDAKQLMYHIALGMDWLHSHDIIHRDLKASNVLMAKGETWMSFVADFECSVGVLGTGFWRAPKILQACKEKNVFTRPEIFTKQVDIYSYGMTCYEILTGKIPFEGHPWNDYDLVLNGGRPEVPEYVDIWACGLLNWCWQSNATNRPSFEDIMDILCINSAEVRECKRL